MYDLMGKDWKNALESRPQKEMTSLKKLKRVGGFYKLWQGIKNEFSKKDIFVFRIVCLL